MPLRFNLNLPNYSKKSHDLEANLKSIIEKLDRLRERDRANRAELIARLEEENRRWQERNSQLLTKYDDYDHVDPTEFQSLKDDIESLNGEESASETEQVTHTLHSTAELQEKIAAMEKVNKQQKDMITKDNQIFRQRMSSLDVEDAQLMSALEVAQESAAISEKRDTLKAQAAAPEAAVSTSASLTNELERLPRENIALGQEQALQEEKSKSPLLASVADISDLEDRLAAITDERDKLVAEKETWKKAPEFPPETKAVPENWEAEKAELVKNRDEAMTQAKVAREEAEKLREAERGLRMSNEMLSIQIRDQQVARQKAIEEQEAAIKAAVEKATSELHSAPPTTSEEVTKQHVEELRALEGRLVAKHQEELNKATEAAITKVKELQPGFAPGTAPTSEDQKAVIDATVTTALAAKEA